MERPERMNPDVPATAGAKAERDDRPYVVRIRFARSGPAEYLGHLDMMRLFERSLRRADIPLAYSQGYNPRPHLVFALPLGVGVAAESEILDIETRGPFDPALLGSKLAGVLPEGVSVGDTQAVRPTGKSIMGRVVEAVYRLSAPGIAEAAARLEPMMEIPVEKRSKGAMRTLDIRPLLLGVEGTGQGDAVRFRVKAGSADNVRPDLLLQAMVKYTGLDSAAAADAEIVREQVILADVDG